MLLKLTIFISLIYLVDVSEGQKECCEEYCFDTDTVRNQIIHFSTKTAYQKVKGNESDHEDTLKGCTPVKFWLISRHGTRLPSNSSMIKLQELSKLRDEIIKNSEDKITQPKHGALCEADLKLLKEWKWDSNATGNYEEFLTAQGWLDLKLLAKSYQEKFPDLLQNKYTEENFLFRHTDTQRTEASYKAFVEGLFGDKAYDSITLPPIPSPDYLLKPYDNCPAWEAQNDAKDGPDSEISKFLASDLFMKTSSDISTRLGLNYTLNEKKIEKIWDMCRFEQAWYLGKPSPWCAAFTAKEVDVLEYKEDLKYYYKSGHGSKLNEPIACAAVKDMLTQLDDKNGAKTIAYFTHSSELQLFLVALGAAKDVMPLLADNYDQMKNRLWRTSAIGPFGTNVAAIKYDCSSKNEGEKVQFFLNEKPLEFERCKAGVCDWSDVQEKYKQFRHADCDKYFCGGSSAQSMRSSSIILLFSVFFGLTKSIMT